MDFSLHCNFLKCRSQLNDRAVVTTCSHIFCVACSESLSLSLSEGHRNCPACQTNLPNPDDVVLTILNPSEDYKTSVLSGLSPAIIMECAGRAMSFWSYQATQEVVFQEHLAKSWKEKHSRVGGQMDSIVHESNSQIKSLQDKMSSMQGDYEDLQRKNHDLTEAYREKDRKHSQVQQLYDKLKKRSLFTQAQQAASESVEDALQNVAGAGRRVPGSVGTLMNSPRYTASAGNAGQHQRHSAELNIPGLQRSLGGNISQMPPPMHRAGPGFTKPANTLGTPIQHRQQLSMASPRGNLHAPFYQNNRQDNNVGPNHSHMQSPSPKRALHKLNANHGSPRFATYGVSAGMKMSR